ncbi:MAG TPA: hypothetical protein VHD84_02810 [Candidatus Saccharimonadales bacterium]|nr:hypothetical protein [Candidatus Saccharimonadales bacterium]
MPPAQPQTPNSQFDFILKNNPQPRRGLSLGNLKPVKIIIGLVVLIIVVIIISSFLSGGSDASQQITGALARGQEILRVTKEVQQLNLQDAGTQALAATITADLSSDQQQLTNYLAKNGTKVSTAQLALDIDKSTDTQMQTASQNNNLDQTYITYLRESLARYETDLQDAYKVAGPNGKTILQSAFDGTNTLLTTPPLKS